MREELANNPELKNLLIGFAKGKAMHEDVVDFILQDRKNLLTRIREQGPKDTYKDCARCTDSVCARHAAYLVQTETNQRWSQLLDEIEGEL